MDVRRLAAGPLGRLPRWVADPLFRLIGRIPLLRRRIEAEYDEALAGVRPARADGAAPLTRLPDPPLARSDVLAILEGLSAAESAAWRDGFASGAVYHGDEDHIELLERAYSLHSQANPLHADLWPGAVRFEAEITAMTADLLGAAGTTDEIVGTVTSGGTESIVLAMKAYRDRARRRRPEIVAPVTAHVAFDKAADLLGVKLVKVPVGADHRADVAAMANAIGRRTIALVGSAPGFPHGLVDPIEELSELARARGIGFHSDACLGGFVLPFAAELGVDVPAFDFRLPGVTSMSADPHKYGYAAKGTSVVLYRGLELRRHQYFTSTEWPGGLYFSPTIPGSRPGGLSAAAWAAMASMGRTGYLAATRRILETAARLREGIAAIAGLRIIGDPLWVIAFTADDVDIYGVLDGMIRRGWSLNGLHRPPAIHIAVTLRHTREGVVDRFLADLAGAVDEAGDPPAAGSVAPVYGMAATLPARTIVSEMLERYGDMLYDV